jgi:MFS transporter, DHA1 family, inner membrane transport protein
VQGAYFGAGAGAGAVVASYAYGPGEGGKAFATVMGGLTVATLVGSPLGTLIGQHLGWQATYVAVAGVGALASVEPPSVKTGWLSRSGAGGWARTMVR